jgi:hypothetical protein
MPDLFTVNSKTLPLDASPVSCWRCGGPTRQRSGLLRFDPCETCVAMLAEVQARYAGRQKERDEGG